MSEELSPAEKTKFKINYWRNLFLATVFSCCIVVFFFGKLGEILVERETQIVEPQPTQKLFSSAPELAEETPTPHPFKWQETLSDGSTRIADSEAGYELIFPPDWVIIPLFDKEQYDDSLDSLIEMYPETAEIIDFAKELVQEESKVMAIYIDPAQSDDETIPYLVHNYFYLPGIEHISLKTIATDGVEMAKEMFPDFIFYEPECKNNTNEVAYCEFIMDFNLSFVELKMEIRGVNAYIKVEDGMVGLSIGTTKDSYPAFADMFDEIINSIKLID